MTRTQPHPPTIDSGPGDIVVTGLASLDVTPDTAHLLVTLSAPARSRAGATSALRTAQGRLNAVLTSFDRAVAGVKVVGSRVLQAATVPGGPPPARPWAGSADLSVDMDAHVVPSVLAQLRKVKGVAVPFAPTYRIKDASPALAEARDLATRDAISAAYTYAGVFSPGVLTLVELTELHSAVLAAPSPTLLDEALLTGDLPAMVVRAQVQARFTLRLSPPPA